MSLKNNRMLHAFAAYLLCGLIPLVTLLLAGNQALVGEQYSGAQSFWATWWLPQAIGFNYEAAFNNHALFPIGSNILTVLSPTSSLLYAPAALLAGPALAYHLLLWLYLTLNGFSVYLLWRKHGDWLAWWIGLLLTYNPVTWTFASQGYIALTGFFMIPLAMLVWDRFLQKPDTRRTLLMALVLYAALMMNWQFINPVLTLWLSYALFRWWQQRTPIIDGLLLLVVVLALLLIFFPASEILWSSYVDLYEPLTVWQGSQLSADGTLFGATAGLLLTAALWLNRMEITQRRFWGALLALHVIGLLLPALTPLGILQTILPRSQPLVQPALLIYPLLLIGGILTVSSGSRLPEQLRRYGIPAGVLLLIALSGWRLPLPASPLPDTDWLAPLAQDPENYLIALYPVGLNSVQNMESGAEENSFGFTGIAGRAQAYAPFHGKRVIGGIATTLTDAQIALYQDDPLFVMLANGYIADPVAAAPLMRSAVDRWRLAYILQDSANPVTNASLAQWLTWIDRFCLVQSDADRSLWRARWHPAGCPAERVLDIGAETDFYGIGSGWYGAEDWGDRTVRWSGAEENITLTLWLDPSADYTFRLSGYTPLADQQVELLANNQSMGALPLGTEWETLQWTVPRILIAASEPLMLTLRHTRIQALDGRMIAAAYDTLTWIPQEQP